jgi:hypothetical protein
MVRITLLLAAVAALALPGRSAATTFGAAEDAPKFVADAGASLFADMNDVGLSVDRVSVLWDPSDPLLIQRRASLDRAVEQAQKAHVQTVFSVYPASARAVPRTAAGDAAFAFFLQLLAHVYPQVDEFIVGNEPNQPRFWQPQFDSRCRNSSAAAYEALLARSYDALKGVRPAIRVVGAALSPRGNDDCHASDNVSTSPVRFLAALGAAYRASGRRRPLMDMLAFHPYPNPQRQTDPPSRGYQWPNAGVPNLDRIKQAVQDGFGGTAQPTFTHGLQLVLDEVGWQVTIPPALADLYTGSENVRTVSEAQQASYYAEVIRRFTCDPAVDSVFFFHLIDETDLSRFQSGLERVDGSHRPSYEAVKQTLTATGGRCLGKPVRWQPATGVIGAWASLKPHSIAFGAKEDATSTLRLLRVPSRSPVSSLVGRVRAYVSARPAVDAGGVPGTYVYELTLRAAENPARKTVFVSRRFQLG